MASIRLLKKRVQRIVIDLLDDCDYLIVSDSPNADEADRLIDDAVLFHDAILSRISAAKSKAEFRELVSEIDSKEEEFIERLNQVNN